MKISVLKYAEKTKALNAGGVKTAALRRLFSLDIRSDHEMILFGNEQCSQKSYIPKKLLPFGSNYNFISQSEVLNQNTLTLITPSTASTVLMTSSLTSPTMSSIV